MPGERGWGKVPVCSIERAAVKNTHTHTQNQKTNKLKGNSRIILIKESLFENGSFVLNLGNVVKTERKHICPGTTM